MSKRASEIIIRNTFKPHERTNMNKPFALRDRVSLRRTKQGGKNNNIKTYVRPNARLFYIAASCISEMAVLMSCWKENEYSDAHCSNELQIFNKCVAEAAAERREIAQAEKHGTSVGTQMTSKQVTNILKKYPQPR
ncbi:putative coiled-coil-helix-coiled-coil-helix domain-containing protein 1 [Apostichopus japonicus]|uniref:Putative coiled-coil-helix-coiled-coil-helix domain-containing protein 1 n=1 Tax=Stichopus japonicus TaxID=307972 RepID=A0A2G8KD46_STIJA|nr:putative coiled-coil-helix-coiled-coil-helix domain-containing protein 1 [Apostichopus japonicus]